MSPNCALSYTKPMLCVGCLSIDLVTVCNKEPQDAMGHTCLEAQWQRGGHSSNVSVVLRMLGAQVEFFGVLSRSSLLREMLQEMHRHGIDVSHCPRTDMEPAISTIWTSKQTGHRSVVHCSKNFPYVTIEDFKLLDLSQYGWVHFEARNVLDTIPMMRAILDYNNGRTDRIRISLIVRSCYAESLDLFDMCDYVIFSRRLAEQLGWHTPQETCLQLDKNLPLPRSFNVRRPCIICAWGSLGAGCLDTQGRYYELAANLTKHPVDTHCVGETFTAAIIYALNIREMRLSDAVAFGNRVAGHKVTGSGLEHLSTLNIYPVTVPHEDKHRPSNMPDDEEVEKAICQKFMSRPIEYSNGKWATQLLKTFYSGPPKKEEPIVASAGEPEVDASRVKLPTIKKMGSRLPTGSKRFVLIK